MRSSTLKADIIFVAAPEKKTRPMAQLRKGSLIRFADRDSGTPVRLSSDPALERYPITLDRTRSFRSSFEPRLA